jgi:hypothetical protein
MGLEGIEILMEVEDAFDISIEEADAEKSSSPGKLIDVVMSKVAQADAEGCLTQRAFNQLRAVLLKQLPLKRRDIAPSVRMAGLVPRTEREPLLQRLAAELGTPPMPPMVRPQWLVILLVGCCLGLGAAAAVCCFPGGLGEHPRPLFSTALLTAVGLGLLARAATRGCRFDFNPQVATVGDLSRWIVGRKTDRAGSTPRKWTREQVAARVREITIEHLGCAEAYREDGSFVEDLGLH